MQYQFPEDWIPLLGKRIQNVHLKEATKKVREATIDTFRPLLDGTVNWPAVLEALDRGNLFLVPLVIWDFRSRGRLHPARFHRGYYKRRHHIENFFCRIKDWRRLATRFDKLARNFLAATCLVAALYWVML